MMSESENEERPVPVSDLTKPRRATIQTFIGPVRSCGSLETCEKVFLILTTVGLLVTLAFTIYRLTSVDRKSADFTFAWVLLIHTIGCLFLVVYGLMRERPFEILTFGIADVIVLIYCIANYVVNPRWDDLTEHYVKLVRLILLVVFSFPVIILTVYILVPFYQSRDLIFRTVGANAKLQDMCHLTFLNEAWLKLDLLLEVSLVVLVMDHGTDLNTEDIVVLSVGFSFVLAWAILGYFSMRFENKVLVIIFLILWCVEPCYIIYKIVDAVKVLRSGDKDTDVVSIAALVCGVAAGVVHLVILITTWNVWGNFGKGVKEKLYPKPGPDDETLLLNKT